MKAWHFMRDNGKLGYGDGRCPKDGEWIEYTGREPIVLCKRGLHASKNILDALRYSAGSLICRVTLGGDIVKGDYKAVATRRRIEWRINGEECLRHFARLCALDVIHNWGAPDVVIQWLKTGDESLRSAALSAAYSAARSGAYSAAESAARSAAESAARSAARSAAYHAAESAALYAAESAALSAAESAARSAAESAAYSAARSAAESAARERKNRRLHRMVMEYRRKEADEEEGR